MYALEVQINDEVPVIAGADDLGVLNANVTCGGRLGRHSFSGHEGKPHLDVTVGGLTSRPPDVADEHLRWISQKQLQVGDVISIKVLDTPNVNALISGKEAEKMQHDEREYFEHCKKVYLSLREKYEAQ